jgi:hypothetical protein
LRPLWAIHPGLCIYTAHPGLYIETLYQTKQNNSNNNRKTTVKEGPSMVPEWHHPALLLQCSLLSDSSHMALQNGIESTPSEPKVMQQQGPTDSSPRAPVWSTQSKAPHCTQKTLPTAEGPLHTWGVLPTVPPRPGTPGLCPPLHPEEPHTHKSMLVMPQRPCLLCPETPAPCTLHRNSTGCPEVPWCSHMVHLVHGKEAE